MLRTAGDGLMKKTMILGDRRKGRKFYLVSECAWNETEGMIEIELSKSAKKLLLDMIRDEPDTYTKLKYSLQLTGKYTHAFSFTGIDFTSSYRFLQQIFFGLTVSFIRVCLALYEIFLN